MPAPHCDPASVREAWVGMQVAVYDVERGTVARTGVQAICGAPPGLSICMPLSTQSRYLLRVVQGAKGIGQRLWILSPK